jgi:type I restriction enzyme M protein
MLDAETKRHIDNARDVLVGKVPDPKAQIEMITIALIYKFMDDMDKASVEMGGKPSFFTGQYKEYTWTKLMDIKMSGVQRIKLYSEALEKMPSPVIQGYFKRRIPAFP